MMFSRWHNSCSNERTECKSCDEKSMRTCHYKHYNGANGGQPAVIRVRK